MSNGGGAMESLWEVVVTSAKGFTYLAILIAIIALVADLVTNENERDYSLKDVMKDVALAGGRSRSENLRKYGAHSSSYGPLIIVVAVVVALGILLSIYSDNLALVQYLKNINFRPFFLWLFYFVVMLLGMTGQY